MNPREIKKNLEMINPENKEMREKEQTKITKEQANGLIGAITIYVALFFVNWGIYNWLAPDLSLPELTIPQFAGLSLVIHWFTRVSFRNFTPRSH